MELAAFTVVMLGLAGFFAGGLGALVGIGGGVVLVPVLVLGFGADIRLAVATSLVSVVATSTAAGSVYVGKGLANMRLGMTLEIFTTLGGITGGLLAAHVPPSVLAGLFAAMMLLTSGLMLRGRDERRASAPQATPAKDISNGHEEVGTLAGSYRDEHLGEVIHYRAVRVGLGGAVSFVAGIVSGMLGVGGGFIKVPAMHLGMRVPIKVAAATSNFMIGVTAVSSLFVYFSRGMVQPYVAAPVALGVTAGALAGTGLAKRVSSRRLQQVLSGVLVLVAVQMLLKALGVQLGR
ncbi:MAG: sulfite exporter TauE/SafE family protein [Deltaproteobacteria bacterium]|nr:sulfite exporter TauE/SafE family protein [Deltaproteobacteria bacterium]